MLATCLLQVVEDCTSRPHWEAMTNKRLDADRAAPSNGSAGTRRAAGLDDPAYAAFAWARYRRIMRWMTLAAAICAGAAVWALWRWIGPLPIHVAIATALGVGLSVLMAAALMGLIFLSSGSGHDEMVERVDDGWDERL